jgi:hypothetical protein
MGWKQRVPEACSDLLKLLKLHRPKVRLLFQQRSEHERTLKKPHTRRHSNGRVLRFTGRHNGHQHDHQKRAHPTQEPRNVSWVAPTCVALEILEP